MNTAKEEEIRKLKASNELLKKENDELKAKIGELQTEL